MARIRLLALLLVPGFLAWPAAEASGPSAADWLADCSGYLAVLEGGTGDDLEIAHCTGLTLGILAGLETGARLGAVSMGSTLTVLADLEQDEVLEVFRRLDGAGLLRYCLPEGQRLSEVLRVVAEFIRADPARGRLLAPAAFFEALQAAFPCGDAENSGEGREGD
jgi:hypothetical protein